MRGVFISSPLSSSKTEPSLDKHNDYKWDGIIEVTQPKKGPVWTESYVNVQSILPDIFGHKFISIFFPNLLHLPHHSCLPSFCLEFPWTSPILVCSTKHDLPSRVKKKVTKLPVLSLSLFLFLSFSLIKQRSPACVCVCVCVCVCACECVSMHQQLCSRSWREWSALGTARKTVHPDSPAALYKDKGKKGLAASIFRWTLLGLLSPFFFLSPSSCAAAVRNLSPKPCGRQALLSIAARGEWAW